MKFILIAAVALLALAHGSYAEEVSDLERLSQYFEEMKTKLTRDLSELVNNQDMAGQATSFINEGRTHLEPLLTQFQDKMKNVEEQVRPLAANVQAQAQPLIDNFQEQVQAIFKKLMDQTPAVAN
ncbi:type-4 ice-structuring protein-like [Halichoeres trimaculatus]|uniref:type-4 ice-structuring protein-like n=1 Tax=Halichoeres trimaculatus TaxID=147232 RepID=UPI003D9F8C5A